MNTYQQQLDDAIAVKRRYGGQPQPPCDETEIARLVADAVHQLRAAPPLEYLDFLREMNGLDFNGLVIYASRRDKLATPPHRTLDGVVEANLLYREEEGMGEYVVLGEDGDVIYVYERGDRSYSVRDRISLDPDASGLTFDELLVEALERHAA